MVQYLDKQMDTFQVCQFIVSDVHAHREKKSCISSVDNFVCAELQEKSHIRLQELEQTVKSKTFFMVILNI